MRAWGRPKVEYEIASGATAVSSTAATAANAPASSSAISAIAGSVAAKNTIDGPRNPTRPPGHWRVRCSSQKWTGPPPRSLETMWKIEPNGPVATRRVSSSSTLSGAHQTARIASAAASATASERRSGKRRRRLRSVTDGISIPGH